MQLDYAKQHFLAKNTTNRALLLMFLANLALRQFSL